MPTPVPCDIPSRPLRLFIALAAPETVRRTAGAAIEELRPFGDVRWASLEHMHLTLKFLGNSPEEKVPLLEEELRRIANNCLHFAVRLGGIGAFPSVRRPRTVWYGIAGDTGALATLAGRIDAATEKLGFEREGHPYQPHLTLGRVRSPRGLRELATELEKRAANASFGVGDDSEWLVDAIALMRSELKPTGAVYTELSHFPLATTLPARDREQE